MRWAVLLLLLAMTLPGCWSYPVATAPATRPLRAGSYTVLGPADGFSTAFSVLHFFSFGPEDPIGDARDMALEAAKGDALIDVTAHIHHLSFLMLFTIHTTTVQGTAVLDQDAS